jgi:MFS family permease
VAQVPIARTAEGRRRVLLMALTCAIFAGAFLLVAAADAIGRAAYPTLVLAAVAIGVGECFHSTALMPLVADLAPPALRGRYMAAMGLSWWIGLALAPTVGTQLLSVSARATFLSTAALAVAAGVSALALERELPSAARLTPRPVEQ